MHRHLISAISAQPAEDMYLKAIQWSFNKKHFEFILILSQQV